MIWRRSWNRVQILELAPFRGQTCQHSESTTVLKRISKGLFEICFLMVHLCEHPHVTCCFWYWRVSNIYLYYYYYSSQQPDVIRLGKKSIEIFLCQKNQKLLKDFTPPFGFRWEKLMSKIFLVKIFKSFFKNLQPLLKISRIYQP